MANKKDPAMMFYPQDFITGTLFFSHEDVGIYIRLLCAQHQMGGMIPIKHFNSLVPEDSVVREKFIETEDGFYNHRLMEEMVKRAKKSNNLSDNAKKRWEKVKTMQLHSNCTTNAKQLDMPIENENANEIKDELEVNKKGGAGGKQIHGFDANWESAISDEMWREGFCMSQRLAPEQMTAKLNEFKAILLARNDRNKEPKDIQSHFANWYLSTKTQTSKYDTIRQSDEQAVAGAARILEQMQKNQRNG